MTTNLYMSKKLYIVPIEPLSERYTEQWYRRLPKEFEDAGYDVTQIDGVPLLDNEIKVGTFLDINSTTHYKWSQLQAISKLFYEKKIENGTTFFFSDIEFWGLEGVRLLAQMNNIKIRIFGFLHAASYTKEDVFAVAGSYQRYTEVGWIAACDKVFVGSKYHKDQVLNLRLFPANALHLHKRIVVTKNPIFLDEYGFTKGTVPKQKTILLTNRLDAEKRPYETLQMFKYLGRRNPDWRFVLTSGRPTLRGSYNAVELALHLERYNALEIKVGLTKEQYHAELAKAAIVVSHSIEENYGYCIAEALVHDCLPFLLEGSSHPEFVPQSLLFSMDNNDEDYAPETKLENIMRTFGTAQWPQTPILDSNGLNNIIFEMDSCNDSTLCTGGGGALHE